MIEARLHINSETIPISFDNEWRTPDKSLILKEIQEISSLVIPQLEESGYIPNWNSEFVRRINRYLTNGIIEIINPPPARSEYPDQVPTDPSLWIL